MKNKKVSKHYNLNYDIVNKIQRKSEGKYKSETEAVEHYLELGMHSEETNNSTDLAILEINACLKEVKYVKKLVEQLFTNMKYPKNKDVNKDDALKEFKKDLFKNKYND